MKLDIREEGMLPAEDEMRAELESLGLPYIGATEVQPGVVPKHWHDFSSVFWITEGVLTLTNEETGETCTLGPGARVSAPAGVLHSEKAEAAYSIFIGVDKDPSTFPADINLKPEAREAWAKA